VLQLASVRLRCLAGNTGWNFAQQIFKMFKACLFSEIFIQCVMGDEECSTETLFVVKKNF